MNEDIDLNKNVQVSDTNLNFEKVYQKNYIPQKYSDEIKEADVLILPYENYNDKIAYCFPESTREIYLYLKKQESIKTEICIDDDEYDELERHADLIYIACIIVSSIVLPILINLISDYLYDKVKNLNKKNQEVNVDIHIIVDKNGNAKKIDYKGSVEDFEATMDIVEKDLFK